MYINLDTRFMTTIDLQNSTNAMMSCIFQRDSETKLKMYFFVKHRC